MNPPLLNCEMVLEAPGRIGDQAGGYVMAWTALGTLWAELSARSGCERALGGAPTSQVAYKIVVRGTWCALWQPRAPHARTTSAPWQPAVPD